VRKQKNDTELKRKLCPSHEGRSIIQEGRLPDGRWRQRKRDPNGKWGKWVIYENLQALQAHESGVPV